MKIYKLRKYIIGLSILVAILSAFFATQVKFVFDLERFFPQGDEDLAFFYEFREEFEDDDNFLLIAFTDTSSIFNTKLLTQVDNFTKASSQFDYVRQSNSITNFKYFVKLQFGGFSPPFPALNLHDPSRMTSDSVRVMKDERIVGNLIAKDSKSTVVILKTDNALNPEQSSAVMKDVLAALSDCLLYTSPSPRDHPRSRMPSSA